MMTMAKSRKVAIMVAEQYQVTEIWYPYYRLKEAGIDCDFVAAEANKDYQIGRASCRERVCLYV